MNFANVSSTSSAWSSRGCVTTGISKIGKDSFQVGCECNHCTDFSLGNEIADTFKNSGLQYFNDWNSFKQFSLSKVKSKSNSLSFYWLSNLCDCLFVFDPDIFDDLGKTSR